MRPSHEEGDFFPLGGREIPTGMSRRLGVTPHPGRGKRYPRCAQLHPLPLLHPLCPLHPVPQQSHSPPVVGPMVLQSPSALLATPPPPPSLILPPPKMLSTLGINPFRNGNWGISPLVMV